MRGRTAKVVSENAKANPDNTTRDQFLAAAGDLMIERSSTEISFLDIAQKSGHNPSLIKYYFGNKAGLLMALLRKALGPGIAQLEHLTAMKISPQDKLRIHVSGMVNSYFRSPYANRLMHQLLSDDPEVYGTMIAEEFSKPVAKAQKEILAEGVRAGIFREIDPILFYFHVVGACDQLFYGRYQLRHVFGVSEISETLKQQYIQHLYKILINGIMINPAPETSELID